MNKSKLFILAFALTAATLGVAGCAATDTTTREEVAAPVKTATSAAPNNAATLNTAGGVMPDNASSTARGTAVGNLAPDFQLARTDGAPASLASMRGQPAVVVFWTAWCPFCKEEAPRINELAAQYESKGVRVLGINIQDSEARTAGGVKEFGIKYAVARDADASVAKLYKVQGTPTVMFLDKEGVVRYNGNELPKDYTAQLDALL